MRALFYFGISLVFTSCQMQNSTTRSKPVHLVTLDPGHFHAALVQKTMYEDVDTLVHVYAPPGNDLQLHLARIKVYNDRTDQPTHWKEEVYTGNDFFDRMLQQDRKSVV